ncbi:hypothetical protein Purlil1_10377 [Purpureocillium lilacinum]|uniref:Uncharacterized protein n=1 Tax=Purpureocillium lilacinum TaxID=33203 RepID=A0ABR0BMV2_PURLI|nr:hypothetical protein Purlil1_10377 [Purpureocillium lilacinum]
MGAKIVEEREGVPAARAKTPELAGSWAAHRRLPSGPMALLPAWAARAAILAVPPSRRGTVQFQPDHDAASSSTPVSQSVSQQASKHRAPANATPATRKPASAAAATCSVRVASTAWVRCDNDDDYHHHHPHADPPERRNAKWMAGG